MGFRSLIGTAVAGAALAFGGVASADSINIFGPAPDGATGSTGNTGVAFTGSITYQLGGFSGGNADLKITLRNTDSPPSTASLITGFVFNIDGAHSGISLVPNPTGGFQQLLSSSQLSASPFGTFEAGAALGGDWEGGGSPGQGIANGDSMDFYFSVKALSGTFSADAFMSELSQGGNPSALFAVRFRQVGANGQDSDKVLAGQIGDGTGGEVDPVPLPGVALAGLVLLGGVGCRRLRRQA